jgi:hypothetical protein
MYIIPSFDVHRQLSWWLSLSSPIQPYPPPNLCLEIGTEEGEVSCWATGRGSDPNTREKNLVVKEIISDGRERKVAVSC